MLPAGTRCPASAAASSNCRSARSKPCMTDIVPGNRTLSRQNTRDLATFFSRLLGRYQLADQYLATALAFHERLGAAPWIARTHVEQARLLLATGNHARALRLLAAAAEITTQCSMSTLAADI